jgi:hypothetical protein
MLRKGSNQIKMDYKRGTLSTRMREKSMHAKNKEISPFMERNFFMQNPTSALL